MAKQTTTPPATQKPSPPTAQELIPAGKQSASGTALAASTLTEEEQTALAILGDAPGGLDDITKDDIAIPFLGIIQALSPQLEPGNAKYLEEAKIGMIIQTVSCELMKRALVIPVDYRRSFCEWVPRATGGGFRGESGMEREEEFNRLVDRKTGIATLENGNHLIDTRNFYVFAGSSPESLEPMVISMSRTQTKKAKMFVNLIQNYVPLGAPQRVYPAWAATYEFASVLEKNEKGSWYGWAIRRLGMNTNAQLLQAAERFKKQIRGGIVTINRDEEVVVGEEPAAGQM